MPSIGIADKVTLDLIKGIVDDINLAVAALEDAVGDSIGGIETNVGSNADASSASGSAHAKLKDIKSVVGLTNDSGNIAGSANAKLAALAQRNGYLGNPTKINTTGSSWVSITQGYWNTILSLSGSGVLYDYSLTSYNAMDNYDYIQGLKITVDGSLIYNVGPNVAIHGITLSQVSSTWYFHHPLVGYPIKFASTLVIEVFAGRGNTIWTARGNYKLGVA